MTEPVVVVIGGGLAGLASAVALTEQGCRVHLLESRPRWGGRASSFVDHESGEAIDNCQHVAMGCCTNFLHFLETVGASSLFRVENELTFVSPDGRQTRFAECALPAPGHLAFAFASLPYLNWNEKLRLARAVLALARLRPDQARGRSCLDWLESQGQSENVIHRVWEVLLASALSESLDRIDLAYARKVIVDGFLAHRAGWRVSIPTVPLGEVYQPIVRWLEKRGARIDLRTRLSTLRCEDGRIRQVEAVNGEVIRGSDFILAVPHHAVSNLLPEAVREDPVFKRVDQIESAPISSVHLWYDRPLCELPHAVLVGRISQWLFSNWLMHDEGAVEQGFVHQVVISASRHLRQLSQSETIEAVHQELRELFPGSDQATLLRGRVVTEHRAVFSATPGIDTRRPLQQSPVPNLQLAGDWTQTGWPSTMESAVRSGYLAAENILRRHGIACSLLQPDLKPSFWSRWLLNLPRLPHPPQDAGAS